MFVLGRNTDQPKSMWNNNILYHKIPTSKKTIGDLLYDGMPDKCTIDVEGHNDLALLVVHRDVTETPP